MNRVLALVTAEFLHFQLLRHGLLVLGRRVIPTFALSTLKGDDFSSCACHGVSRRLFSMEPSTRFELVTPSLPRTCSTPELRGRTRGCEVPRSRGVLLRDLATSQLRDRKLERETGFEPATNSLEGCDSTPELLPLLKAEGRGQKAEVPPPFCLLPSALCLQWWREEDSNLRRARPGRFTVCCF